MANPVSIMSSFKHKGSTRRAFIGGLTISLAPAAHMLPDIYAEVTAAEPPIHPILALPFVRDCRDDERASGAAPRSYWHVSSSGNYHTDCATGEQYATLAVDYMVAARSPHLLAWIVSDMMAMCRLHSGIEVGFLSTFGQLATQACARAAQMEGGTA